MGTFPEYGDMHLILGEARGSCAAVNKIVCGEASFICSRSTRYFRNHSSNITAAGTPWNGSSSVLNHFRTHADTNYFHCSEPQSSHADFLCSSVVG
jgi:hypothetical protein